MDRGAGRPGCWAPTRSWPRRPCGSSASAGTTPCGWSTSAGRSASRGAPRPCPCWSASCSCCGRSPVGCRCRSRSRLTSPVRTTTSRGRPGPPPSSRGSSWPTPGSPTPTGATSAPRSGGFLAVLHAQAPPPGLPVDPNRRADMAVRVPWAREHRGASRGAGAARRRARRGSRRWPPRRWASLPRRGRCSATATCTCVTCWCDGRDGQRRHRLGRRLPGRPGPRPVLRLRRADRGSRGTLPDGVRRRRRVLPDRATEVRARLIAVGLCAMLATTAHEGGDAALREETLRGVRRALS